MNQQAISERPVERSRKLREKAERLIPGGAQTFSKAPMSFVQGVAPNFVARAKGAHVWDVDGNRYLDYIMGLGPVILGHADAAVNEAVRVQMEDGVSFSLPHPIELDVAELLQELIPCAEMVRFGKNGSDVTAAAVRVARAYTRRDKIACSGYHGWQDWYIGSTNRYLGVPAAVRQLTLRFPYGDLEALNRLFGENKNEIACVIMEPLTFDPPQSGYLQAVKELCRANKALLVFDEIITGFRLAMGGAQEYFGVIPDLACFGKAMANGFPLAAIVGQAKVMRLFEEVFFSFTFGGEAVSLAACRATIAEMRRRLGIAQLWRNGQTLKVGISRLLAETKLSDVIRCVGLPPFSGLRFQGKNEGESMLLRSLFQQEVMKRGLLTLGNHMLSLAHDDQIVSETLTIYGDALSVLAEAVRMDDVEQRLLGPPVRSVIRQA